CSRLPCAVSFLHLPVQPIREHGSRQSADVQRGAAAVAKSLQQIRPSSSRGGLRDVRH
ncbi:unnamed protein product, partial [Symbiodinium necroappetens]